MRLLAELSVKAGRRILDFQTVCGSLQRRVLMVYDFSEKRPLPESFGIARELTDEFPFSFMKCIKAEFEKVAISDAVGGS